MQHYNLQVQEGWPVVSFCFLHPQPRLINQILHLLSVLDSKKDFRFEIQILKTIWTQNEISFNWDTPVSFSLYQLAKDYNFLHDLE